MEPQLDDVTQFSHVADNSDGSITKINHKKQYPNIKCKSLKYGHKSHTG